MLGFSGYGSADSGFDFKVHCIAIALMLVEVTVKTATASGYTG